LEYLRTVSGRVDPSAIAVTTGATQEVPIGQYFSFYMGMNYFFERQISRIPALNFWS